MRYTEVITCWALMFMDSQYHITNRKKRQKLKNIENNFLKTTNYSNNM